MHWISIRYEASKLLSPQVEFQDFVDVFEDKVNGWYLNWASEIGKDQHAGYAVLLIAFSYFEGITIFRNGKSNGSKNDFIEGVKRIFGEDFDNSGISHDAAITFLYQEGRCGFYHSGFARKGIILEDGEPILRIKAEDINGGELIAVRIDRRKFLAKIIGDFRIYISTLRLKSDMLLCENFKKSWNEVHKVQMSSI